MGNYNPGGLIEKVLAEHPKTRSSDKFLLVKVWEEQMGQPMHPRLRDFILNKAIHSETLTRTRRKLQEEGKYLADPEVAQARAEKAEQLRMEIVEVDGERVARML